MGNAIADKVKAPEPTKKATLPAPLHGRLVGIYYRLNDVCPDEFDVWEGNFLKDAHPEREIRIWERMADAFEVAVDGQDWPLSKKKAVFAYVFSCVSCPKEYMPQHTQIKELTGSEAKTIHRIWHGY